MNQEKLRGYARSMSMRDLRAYVQFLIPSFGIRAVADLLRSIGVMFCDAYMLIFNREPRLV